MRILKSISLLRVAQTLFLLNSIIWCSIGVATLVRMDGVNPGLTTTHIAMAFLIFGNAAALFVCTWAVRQQKDKLDYLILTVLILNLSLTITDEFGWLDALMLALYVVLLGMVVALRSRRRGAKHADQHRIDREGKNGSSTEKIDRG